MPVTTISSNTRASRSRFSSPQVTASESTTKESSAAAVSAAEGREPKKSTFLERWLEPPVQSKPSYQEAGLVRQGVFDNMAPLGTMPKLGVFKSSSAATPTPAANPPKTRIVLKSSRPAAPSTPTPAAPPPPPPPAPEEDETEEEDETAEPYTEAPYLERIKSEDRGRAEGINYRETTPAVSAPSRSHGSFSSRDVEVGNWGPGRMSQVSSTDRRSQSRASASSHPSHHHHIQQQPSTSSASREDDLKKITAKVVEAAVEAALQFCRYPTAWALRTLYDENCTSLEFLTMIEKVFMQKADAPTLSKFAKDIQKKKKEGKASNQGFQYFFGHEQTSIPPAKPAPYNHLINFGVSLLHFKESEPAPKTERQSTLDRHTEQPEPEPETRTVPAPACAPPQQQESPVQPEPAQEPVQLPLREATPLPAAVAESPPVVEDSVGPLPSDPEPVGTTAPDTEPEQTPELPQRNEPQAEPERQEDKEPEEPPRKKRKSARHSEATSKKMMEAAAAAAASATTTTTQEVDGKLVAETPRRRTRATSHSSTSTLSTARSLSLTPVAARHQAIENEEALVSDAPPSRNSPAPAQPINGKRRRSNAPRKIKGGNVSPSRRSSVASAAPRPAQSASNSRRQTPAVDQSLVDEEPYDPGATVDTFITSLNGKKNKPAIVFTSKVGKLDENDEKTQRRRQAKEVTNGKILEDAITKKDASGQWEYSNARGLVDQPLADESMMMMETPNALATRLRATLPASRSTPAAREGRSTRSARKRSHDEVEDPTSPITPGFPNSAAPSTAANSRAGTPATLRPAKKARTGLRVKNSPMKKKTGPLAGIPRPSGERSSPVGNGPVGNPQTHTRVCVCMCVCVCVSHTYLTLLSPPTTSLVVPHPPPKLARDAMPNEWFCNVCRMTRELQPFREHTGSFALLFEKLEAKNSTAFALPPDIRNCFEGVRTGPEGEYEEILPVVKTARKKKSDEEAPDFFRLRDAEGNAAICHSCQKHSTSDRAIIPCSACGIFWHLDCLDPPLANPPVLRTWKCPLHIDELLAEMPEVLAPAHRVRKPKTAGVIRPAFSRGFINDGYIDVALEEDTPASSWRNSEAYGRTVRLPERGIRADFLSRARFNRKGKPIPPLNAATTPAVPLTQRTLEEQQAVRNLAQLSGQGTAPLTTLIDTLIAQADPCVVNLMSRGSADHFQSAKQLTRMDQQSLRAMLAQAEVMSQQIRQLLSSGANGTAPAVPSLTTSMSIDGDSEADKVAPSPAATDDVPAMTQGEKTPALGDQSPEAPLEENPGKDANLPTTPTKATSVGTEPAIVESNSDDKNSVNGDVMDLE
ncbi:uncharacterized protein QC764_708450 [Podospora pseudoanserina]|uniref:Zinc finger PHD-type domain-containing protein n=1 Tax=Podospora pseudoanserina TaxID=2609844 RepID=A0ABR0HL35_9PEZI|nr:hypothetical protein QC764_708450 [Podospora pseudoanserina]